MDWFRRLTLSTQFFVASFPILLAGMLVIGLVVEHEIERGVVRRIAEVQSLYVDSLVAPNLAALLADPRDPAHRDRLDTLFSDTPLGRKLVAFILWRPDGTVLYSNEHALIGRVLPIGPGLATAMGGSIYSKVIDRREQPHDYAQRGWPDRLIETYAPVPAQGQGGARAIAEFYQTTDELDRAMTLARTRTWGTVAATTVAMLVILSGLVRRASRTIVEQRRELNARVAELSALLDANQRLDAKVRRAAAETTTLSERFLRRVAADLHDGPAQDLGFAQMRLVSMTEGAARTDGSSTLVVAASDLAAVRTAVDTAMADLRSISAGLQLPEIERLAPTEIAARAVRDYERKTGASVAWSGSGEAGEAPLAVKIAIYRVLQELLANGLRHAGGVGQTVDLTSTADQVTLRVGDRGQGFDAKAAGTRDRGGIAGMRERVEALGGVFELVSTPGAGTVAHVRLPLRLPEAGHA